MRRETRVRLSFGPVRPSDRHRAAIFGRLKRQNAITGLRTCMTTLTEIPTMLTRKRLREKLRYDPTTGIFTFARGKRRGMVAGTTHDARGFLKVSIDTERHLLHRLAWLWMTGLHAPVSVEQSRQQAQDWSWRAGPGWMARQPAETAPRHPVTRGPCASAHDARHESAAGSHRGAAQPVSPTRRPESMGGFQAYPPSRWLPIV